jgi:hypothetical protein
MAKSPTINHGNFPTIAFVNLATVSLGVDLRRLVSALDKQLQRDFVPIWGYPATLYVADKPKPREWQIVFLDDSDAADALGYHDLTKDGQPVSKVFVKTTIAAKQKVSVTASHELLEMLIDPGAQLWARNSNGWFYACEVCDAVEDEEYVIDDVAVSDFVYPSFFESWHQPMSTRFDHLEKVSRPFQTLQNGYQVVSNGAVAREIFGSRPVRINARPPFNGARSASGDLFSSTAAALALAARDARGNPVCWRSCCWYRGVWWCPRRPRAVAGFSRCGGHYLDYRSCRNQPRGTNSYR